MNNNSEYYRTTDIINHLTTSGLPYAAAEFREAYGYGGIAPLEARSWFERHFTGDSSATFYNGMARATTLYTRQLEINGDSTEYQVLRG